MVVPVLLGPQCSRAAVGEEELGPRLVRRKYDMGRMGSDGESAVEFHAGLGICGIEL